jgi:hypothetical protein
VRSDHEALLSLPSVSPDSARPRNSPERPTTPRGRPGPFAVAVRRSSEPLPQRRAHVPTNSPTSAARGSGEAPRCGATTEPACRSRASAQTRLDRGTPRATHDPHGPPWAVRRFAVQASRFRETRSRPPELAHARRSWKRRSAPVWSDHRARRRSRASAQTRPTTERPEPPTILTSRPGPFAVPFAVQASRFRGTRSALPNLAQGSRSWKRRSAPVWSDRRARLPIPTVSPDSARPRNSPSDPRPPEAALGRSPFAVPASRFRETRPRPPELAHTPAAARGSGEAPRCGATTEPACRSRASAQTRLDRGTPPSDPRLPGAALGRCRPPTVTSRHPPATSGHADPALRASGTRGRPGRPGARLAAPAGTARPG